MVWLGLGALPVATSTQSPHRLPRAATRGGHAPPMSRTHHEPAEQLLGRLACHALLTGLAVGLLFLRVARADTLTFGFLAFNLVLAWIPFALGEGLVRARGPAAVALGVLWVLFFPNAPYLVTDFVHLRPRSPVPLWYDVLLLCAFAWAGLLLALDSLDRVHEHLEGWLGPLRAWLVVATVCFASGLGVYLGRFLRWNSWDVFFAPSSLLSDVWTAASAPREHVTAWFITVVFGVLLLASHGASRARRRERVVHLCGREGTHWLPAR